MLSVKISGQDLNSDIKLFFF